MKKYDFKKIEKHWQKEWADKELYKAEDFSKKQKYYALIEFPYPSGDGLHVGHVRSYTAIDAVARWRRMSGYNVMYPIGWDAFGLPTENYAIKNKIHPRVATEKNVKNFTRQIKSLGVSFDWSREINTTDPKYYKWTQWIFLQFFKAGLAYNSEISINWCPKCKTGLANEEVIDGRHERCGTIVTRKRKKQWILGITKYADRLIEDLKLVDFPERVKAQQINWIGRSEGALIKFSLRNILGQEDDKHFVEVFTTRADTIFGATFLVISPEKAQEWITIGWKASKEVVSYVKSSLDKSELERQETKEKTGVNTGIFGVHPLTNELLPVWVADYVLGGYGTGAVMAVPAHDERDFEFANKFNLPIKVVIEPVTGKPQENEEHRKSIVAIVENPKTKEVLSVQWKKEFGGNLFVGGGLEQEEDPVACAMREIEEETGYYNLKFVSKTETIHHHYTAHSKGVNRIIDAIGLYFILEDESKKEQKLTREEKGKFTIQWLTKEEAERKVEDPLHKYVFERLMRNKIYSDFGILTNSNLFSGMNSEKGAEAIINELEKKGLGKKSVSYKLRDWVFSRQHYWGEPIPLVFCESCVKRAKEKDAHDNFSEGELCNPGWVAVPETDLPVKLPEVKSYEPTDSGESPLADMKEWVNVKCPKCHGPARRETDTMPNWAGSNWYFARYTDPDNEHAFADKKKLAYWMGVDLYNGGMEHTTLHLLYSRFVYKFLYDKSFVPSAEPYASRRSHGIVLAEDGRKMSKSYGNVVNPDEVVELYGADTLRLYEMFMAPFEQMVAWSSKSIVGVYRFLDRVWKLYNEAAKNEKKDGKNEELENGMKKLIKKVTNDLASMKFNTAVAAFMDFSNRMARVETIPQSVLKQYAQLLAPFAPHIAEELWVLLGNKDSIHAEKWPHVDEKEIIEEFIDLVVQVNGKVRGKVKVKAGIPQEEAEKFALQSEHVQKYLEGKKPIKIIYTGKLINFVI